MNSQDERQHGTLHKALPQQQNPALLMGQSYEATRCSDYEDPSNPTDNDQYTDSSCGYSSSEDIAESSSPPTPLPTGTKSARNQPSSHNQIYHNITHTTKTAGVPVRAAMNDSAGIPMTTVTHTNNNNHESLDTNNYNNNTIFTDTTDNIASSSSSIAINVGDASGTDQCPPDLPPRPLQAVPLLPPRPSQSTLVRAQTIAASSSSSRRRANLNRMSSPPIGGYPPKSNPNNKVNIRRSNTTANIRQHRNGLYKTEAMPVCPDFSHASRRPPGVLNEKPMITTGHRSNYVLAALGSRFFTGHYSLRIWDVHTGDSINTLGDMNNPSENDKIRAILPAPCPVLANEGRFVWVAKQDSNIYIVDTNQPSFNNKMDAHTAPVTFLLRYRNTEVWSIDEAGILNVWNAATRIPVCYGTTMPNATAATIQGRTLWISHERSLRVFDISSNNKASMIADIQTPNELGAITSLITIPFHQNCIFSSHEYGKIARWDATTRKKLQVITVSMYGICSMVTVGQHYVWAGYTTGMIYVYDTQPENWVVVKSWKAHSGAVSHLVVDHSGFVLKSSKDGKDGRAHVFSGDSTGTVGIWDGLLTDYWKETNLQKRQDEFCTYRENNIMICSWNIDANKPEKLVDEHEQIREWLKGMDDPNIIVIGIQEIINLESKKQTARSFFTGRKKGDTPESDEGLTRRYKLWHDYLVRCVNENFGENTYYVAKTDQLVGLFSCIFLRAKEKDRLSAIDSTSVKTGLKVMNKSIHGNKGGIAIRLIFDDSSLCFVNCHLAAGQSHVKQRNADIELILNSANYPYLQNQMNMFSHGGDGAMILDHEFCFLSGDLNYRVDASRRFVIDKLIVLDRGEKEDARKELLGKDQLLRQRITNPLLKILMFQEAPINFNPTYKYNPGTDVYDQSEKMRVPAWCDRILYKGTKIETLYYRRYEVRGSDHRPIASGLRFNTKTVDREKRRVLNLKIENEWQKYMSRFTQNRKVAYIADYEKCTEEQAVLLLEKVNWDVKEAATRLQNETLYTSNA